MAKLETFDNRQTSWQGLWWHPEYNSFSSAAIDLSQIRKFKGTVRLYVKKNKFYNGGENGRPNYHFCMKDAKSDNPKMVEVESQPIAQSETPYIEEESENLYTEDQVNSIIRGMESYYGLPYGENLISDFI